MQTGFYNEPDIDDTLEALIYPANPAITGTVFLHGVCGIFALALHDTYGYELGWILDDDDENESEDPWHHLAHVFCLATSESGDETFVDIRGCQPDECEFEAPFADFFCEPGYDFGLSRDDIYERICMDMSHEEFEAFYAAAKYFISRGDSIYRLS